MFGNRKLGWVGYNLNFAGHEVRYPTRSCYYFMHYISILAVK